MVEHNGSVLLVDDDEGVLDTHEKLLTRFGYQVHTVTDVDAAAGILARHTCHVLVLDLRLSGMSGMEWLGTYRPQQWGPEVIMLTGHATIPSAVEAMRLGAFDYLTKPVKLEEFVDRVEAAAQRCRMRLLAGVDGDRYRLLVESLPVGVVETTPTGSVCSCNPRGAHIFGYDCEHFRQLDVEDLYVSPADRSVLKERLAEKGIHSFEYPMRHREGHTVWVRGSSRVTRQAGNLVYVSIFEDVTRERELAAELKQSRGEVDSLRRRMEDVSLRMRRETRQEAERSLAPALHRVRQDLAWLAGNGPRIDAEGRARIASTVHRLRECEAEIVALAPEDQVAGAESGLRDAVEAAAARLRERCGLTADLVLEVGDEDIDAEAVSVLRYAVQALTDNVIRHAAATQVRIHLEKVEGELVLEITDNGRGITPAQMEGPASPGLDGVRSALRASGGQLLLKGGDQGTSVRIVQPLPGHGGPAPGRCKRALLVSDCDLLRLAWGEILSQNFDLRTEEVRTKREMKDHIWNHAWDLIILDATLTGAQTLPVMQRLHEEQRQAAVIVTVGRVRPVRVGEIVNAGALGCMTDRCDEHSWRQAIEAVLAERRYVSACLAGELASDGKAPHGKLSVREFETLCDIAAGKCVKEIAAAAGLSAVTVRKTRQRLLKKMQMTTDGELIRYALQWDLVD